VLLDLADEQAEVMLPGGPLLIAWPGRRGSVLMTGPAEAVFDGVITPELVPAPSPSSESVVQPEAITPVETTSPPSPEDEAAALAKVQAFLNDTSLDSMLNLASDSLEQRTRSRFERGGS
jgi:diaminopimelate epimerase